MSSLSSLFALLLAAAPDPLRVCADPNNLPYSNARGEGFENALARLVAKDMDRPLQYTFLPQRRGFIRNTLKAGRCDVVMGIPAKFEMALPTQPYYRSSYVFVTRRRDHLDVHSFDDPRLRHLRIGLHAIGDDYNNGPPAVALAQRGIVENVRGYSIYGDYSQPDPPRALIDAVAAGEIDVAIAWGPTAGYFAEHARVPLAVRAVDEAADTPPLLRTRFAIAMGVRRGDTALRDRLDASIAQHRREIDRLLARYGVPRAEEP